MVDLLPIRPIATSLHRQDLSCIECRHMGQVPLIVLALHDIPIVHMFILLQMFCPEFSHVHHGI